MINDVALTLPTPRDIVRRAGLVSNLYGQRPRNVLDVYMDSRGDALLHQWTTDFTGFSRVRFSAQSSVPVYVMYSHSLEAQLLDPGDYAVLTANDPDNNPVEVSASIDNSTGDLRWLTLPEERKAAMRLTLSSAPELAIMETSIAPFSASLQLY